MTSDPTPDRHREARPLTGDDDDLMQRLATEGDPRFADTAGRAYIRIRTLQAALATPTRDAQPAPAGPEEPREGLDVERLAKAIRSPKVADIAIHYDPDHAARVIAREYGATPAPDTGAEERLRAALRAGVEAMRFPDATYVERAAVLRLIDTALSGGSVDEERDSDES